MRTELIIATALLLTACAKHQPLQRGESGKELFLVEQRESANAMKLKMNQELILRLPANPTTGYNWNLMTPLTVLQSEGAPAFEKSEAPAGATGVGGNEVWKFRALRAGEQLLRFEYRRPWEKDAAPDQISTYHITVR